MIWEDECYLLTKRKFRENAMIINIFTSKRGKVTGIVYGGSSRKIRNYLQISNKLYVLHNSKNENKLGYLKIELIKAISPVYFNDKRRSSALISACNLLNNLLPEAQPNKNTYLSFEHLVKNFNMTNWIALYIYFELSLIKELGYDANLNSIVKSVSNTSDCTKFKIDGYLYEIPNFLILNKLPENLDFKLIKKSLIFTRSIFLNKFFIPNNLKFPDMRVLFENYFN